MIKGGIGGLMKQAQQMQENMKKMQEQLATVEVEGVAGGGMVKVLMTCRNDVKRVTIDASVMDDVLDYVKQGRLRCTIEHEFPLQQARDAIERSRSGRVQGKIVLVV